MNWNWIIYLLKWFRGNYPAGDNFISYRSCHWLVIKQQVEADWLSRNKGERKWLRVEADVRGAGTRDEPLRMSAWEASVPHAVENMLYLDRRQFFSHSVTNCSTKPTLEQFKSQWHKTSPTVVSLTTTCRTSTQYSVKGHWSPSCLIHKQFHQRRHHESHGRRGYIRRHSETSRRQEPRRMKKTREDLTLRSYPFWNLRDLYMWCTFRGTNRHVFCKQFRPF